MTTEAQKNALAAARKAALWFGEMPFISDGMEETFFVALEELLREARDGGKTFEAYEEECCENEEHLSHEAPFWDAVAKRLGLPPFPAE